MTTQGTKGPLYFAYGSNLLLARLEERLGRCERRGIGWLDGYALRFHKHGRDGSGKGDAFYTAEPDHRLYGALFELSGPQKRRLDGFEGEDYRCDLLEVTTLSGPVPGWVYVARASAIDPELQPFDWYLKLVEQGAAESQLPLEYVQQLGRVPTSTDPDSARAHRHFALLR